MRQQQNLSKYKAVVFFRSFFCVYLVWRWLSEARQWMNVLKKMKKKCCLDSLTWEHGYCNYYNNCTQQLCFWWVIYSAGHTWPTCHLQSRSLMIVLILMNHPTKLFITQHLISSDVVLCKGSFNLKRIKLMKTLSSFQITCSCVRFVHIDLNSWRRRFVKKLIDVLCV